MQVVRRLRDPGHQQQELFTAPAPELEFALFPLCYIALDFALLLKSSFPLHLCKLNILLLPCNDLQSLAFGTLKYAQAPVSVIIDVTSTVMIIIIPFNHHQINNHQLINKTAACPEEQRWQRCTILLYSNLLHNMLIYQESL